jgi:hypothetical protein
MSVLGKPSTRVGQRAAEVLENMHSRGLPSSWLAGDRAYTNAKPVDFQLPARALGHELVLDYTKRQLGVQGSHDGALLVDGNWYCPMMPPALINATLDAKDGKIDDTLQWQRVDARGVYRFRPNGKANDDGDQRMLCPAGGTCPTARCDLKPNSVNDETAGKHRILPDGDLLAEPSKCCTQQTITIPADAGAKTAQRLPHASREWHARYHSLRNDVEGFNGYVKDKAYEDLENSQNRRVRGVAAQTIFTAFLVFSANVRAINEFLDVATIGIDGVPRRAHKPRPPRRKGRTLASYRARRSPGTDPPTPTAS